MSMLGAIFVLHEWTTMALYHMDHMKAASFCDLALCHTSLQYIDDLRGFYLNKVGGN